MVIDFMIEFRKIYNKITTSTTHFFKKVTSVWRTSTLVNFQKNYSIFSTHYVNIVLPSQAPANNFRLNFNKKSKKSYIQKDHVLNSV